MQSIRSFWQRPWRMVRLDLRDDQTRVVDAPLIVAHALEHGANAILLAGAAGVTLPPLSGPPPSQVSPMGFLDAIVREAHRQGMKVLAALGAVTGLTLVARNLAQCAVDGFACDAALSAGLDDLLRKRGSTATLALSLPAAGVWPVEACAPTLPDAERIWVLEGDRSPCADDPSFRLWAGVQVRMARTLDPARPACLAAPVTYDRPQPLASRPPLEVLHDLLQAVVHGGQPCFVLRGSFEQDDRSALPAIERLYRYLRDHVESYEDLRSPARVLLVYPQSTLGLHADGAAHRHLAEYRGMCEALVELHVPFDVLPDVFLERRDLSHYELVVLPNVASLGERQAEALDGYVASGGHLIATHETARPHQDGPAQGVLTLDCLGRRVIGEHPLADTHLRILDKGLLPSLKETDVVPVEGPFLATQPTGEAALQVCDLMWAGPDGHPRQDTAGAPGLALARTGWGEAAYLPWALGALYHRHGLPVHRSIISDLLQRWVHPLVSTDAPASVELTLHHVRGDRHHALVHLLNATGCAGKPLTDLIALHDIAVWVQGDYATVRELTTERELAFSAEGDGVRLVVPRLESFAAIELTQRT